MRYLTYSTEDFIQDEFFQQWVYTPNEECDRYWQDFLLLHPYKEESINEAKEFLLLMKFRRSVPDTAIESIKNRLNQRIDREELGNKREDTRRTSRLFVLSRRKVYYSMAASIIVATCFIAYFGLYNHTGILLFSHSDIEQYETPKGKQQFIELADGTKVWLNADSRINLPKNFMLSDTREVFLEGEAFFDVAENKDKPFVVTTPEISIRVLGTAFNVKSYARDNFVETTLVRGKITLKSKAMDQSEPVTLTPNQQAVFIKDLKEIVLEENVNSDDYTGWKNGWIVFDDKPFSYIRETLERSYDVSIIMEDESSLTCTFSAKFKDKTLKEVLEIFRNTESINYEIKDDTVFITGKLCEMN